MGVNFLMKKLPLRTNTIWFVVVLHGLHDLCLKYTNFPAILLDVIQVTLLMLYGIYVLQEMNKLRVFAR